MVRWGDAGKLRPRVVPEASRPPEAAGEHQMLGCICCRRKLRKRPPRIPPSVRTRLRKEHRQEAFSTSEGSGLLELFGPPTSCAPHRVHSQLLLEDSTGLQGPCPLRGGDPLDPRPREWECVGSSEPGLPSDWHVVKGARRPSAAVQNDQCFNWCE